MNRYLRCVSRLVVEGIGVFDIDCGGGGFLRFWAFGLGLDGPSILSILRVLTELVFNNDVYRLLMRVVSSV